MASKRHIRRRACENKVRHPDKESARRHAAKLWHEKGERVLPYPCSHCGGYHVGRSRYQHFHGATPAKAFAA